MLYLDFILNSYVAYLNSYDYSKESALILYDEIKQNISNINGISAMKKLDYLDELKKIKEQFIK